MITGVIISVVLLAVITFFIWACYERKQQIQGLEAFGQTYYPAKPKLAASLVEILCEELGISVYQCKPTSHLLEDFGMDEEFEWVSLQLTLNDKLSLDLPLESFYDIITIDDLISMVDGINQPNE